MFASLKMPLCKGCLMLLLLATLIMFWGCHQPPSRQLTVLDGLTMGTTYSVKIATAQSVEQDKIHAAIERLLAKLSNDMSTYLPDSRLSQINRQRTLTWQALTPALYRVIHQALEIGILTGGAFDISAGTLVNLWGFGPDGRATDLPADAAIGQALQGTGFHHIQLSHSPPLIRKDRASLYLDLSGIAKGYGVDVIAEYLEGLGLDNYMVEIGGEIRAAGKNASDTVWRIGIEQAFRGEQQEQRRVQRIIALRDIGMATSGDYRNYYEQDGSRYSHTIDPTSGRPITHNLASVTVLHAAASRADALATALLVLGLEAGYRLAEREAIAAFFIYHTGEGFKETFTPQFAPYLLER